MSDPALIAELQRRGRSGGGSDRGGRGQGSHGDKSGTGDEGIAAGA
jgi:hypothetical protein